MVEVAAYPFVPDPVSPVVADDHMLGDSWPIGLALDSAKSKAS